MILLLPLLALLAPRLVIILVAVFSDYLSRAYDGLLLPVLGFLFLPLTTLVYAWAVNSGAGVKSGLPMILMVAAVLFDLGAVGWRLRGRSS